jgi:hypothetical protein
MVKNYLMENREEEGGQAVRLRWLDDVEADLRTMGVRRRESHSKRQNGMGRHCKGGKSPARSVKPESSFVITSNAQYSTNTTLRLGN